LLFYFHYFFRLIESGSLAALVKKFGVFPEPLVALYIQQALAGLRYLHESNIVHRDIKGDNILITKDGKVKLADFGTAKLEDTDKKSQTVVGTPYWSTVFFFPCGFLFFIESLLLLLSWVSTPSVPLVKSQKTNASPPTHPPTPLLKWPPRLLRWRLRNLRQIFGRLGVP
jgi:hypothetical protein